MSPRNRERRTPAVTGTDRGALAKPPDSKVNSRLIQAGNPTIAPAYHVPGKIEAEVESFNRTTAEAAAWAAGRAEDASSGDRADDSVDQARKECLKIVERLTGSTRHFLDTPQPALGDQTGRELLEQHPADLLRRLRQLEEGL